jgi:hypothetical protein
MRLLLNDYCFMSGTGIIHMWISPRTPLTTTNNFVDSIQDERLVQVQD